MSSKRLPNRAPTFKEFAGDFIVRLKAFMIQNLSYTYLKRAMHTLKTYAYFKDHL